jgi:hypothetical protein
MNLSARVERQLFRGGRQVISGCYAKFHSQGKNMSTTPAGWYPDPTTPGKQRYWDGDKWTEHEAPGAGVAPAAGVAAAAGVKAAKGRKPWYFRWYSIVAGIVIILFVLGVIGQAFGAKSGDNASGSVNPTTTPTTEGSTTPAPTTAAPTTPAPTTAAPTTAAPTTAAPTTAAPTTAAPTTPARPKSQMGVHVRDGKFEFTATKEHCGVKVVGSSGLTQRAQGQYCIVTIKVTNIGDVPQTLFADNQVGFDAKGRKFNPDTTAMIYADNSDVWMSDINPGNTVTGQLIYDVPTGVTLMKLEVHDSMYSGGYTIILH